MLHSFSHFHLPPKIRINFGKKCCTDFYQYACGGWISSNYFPPGKKQYGIRAFMMEQNDRALLEVLGRDEKKSASLSTAEKKVRIKHLRRKNFIKLSQFKRAIHRFEAQATSQCCVSQPSSSQKLIMCTYFTLLPVATVFSSNFAT